MLKDSLKATTKRKPKPERKLEVTVDNQAAAELAETFKQGFIVMLQELHTATLANARLLEKLSDQLDKHAKAIETLAAKEPVAPTVVMPERPSTFEVAIRQDADGKPTALRIVAKNNLH